MSNQKTPQHFARDAENQIADQLALRLGRFRKAKKNRRVLAADVLKWAMELNKLVQLLTEETALPSPVPPLAASAARSAQIDKLALHGPRSSTSPAPLLSTEEMVEKVNSYVLTEQVQLYLENRTTEELARLLAHTSLTNGVKELIEREMRRQD